MKRALFMVWMGLALGTTGCMRTPDLSLDIRLPANDAALKSVSRLLLSAERNGIVLAQGSFAASTRTVSLANVSQGADTIIALDGLDSEGDVVARGSTCPVDYESDGLSAALYFAPTNFFAPTVNAPLLREYGNVLALTSGTVLVAGGTDGTALVTTTEQFVPGAGRFIEVASMALKQPRAHAEAITLPSTGAIIIGGVDQSGAAVTSAELYLDSTQAFASVSNGFDARVEHRLVVGRDTIDGTSVLLTGGSTALGGTPLASTLLVEVDSDGTNAVFAGPDLSQARRSHASVGVSTSTNDRALVFGGYDLDGQPLASIEAVDFTAGSSTVIAQLTYARAEATATFIPNIGILISGGIGADGNPRADGELFDLLSRQTAVYPMQSARVGHSATLLDNDEVLITGGRDATGAPLSSTELFRDDTQITGYVNEVSLNNARAAHVAVPLCDSTVLITGGIAAAELYTEPN